MSAFFRLAPGGPHKFVQLLAPAEAARVVHPLMFAAAGLGGIAARGFCEKDLPDDPMLEGKCAVELLEQVCAHELLLLTSCRWPTMR